MLPQSEKPTRLPSSERTFIVLGDLLTVNAYDKSERTFIVLGDLLTVNAYDTQHTFMVLGDLLTGERQGSGGSGGDGGPERTQAQPGLPHCHLHSLLPHRPHQIHLAMTPGGDQWHTCMVTWSTRAGEPAPARLR